MSYGMEMDGLGGAFDFSGAKFAEMSQVAVGVLAGASVAKFVKEKTKDALVNQTWNTLGGGQVVPALVPVAVGVLLHNAADGQGPAASLWMKSGAAGMIGFGLGTIIKAFLPADQAAAKDFIALGSTDNYEFGYAGPINRYLSAPGQQVVSTVNGLGRAPGTIMPVNGFAAAPSTAEVVSGLHGLSATLM